MAYIPTAVLHERSAALLRRLLLLSGVVLVIVMLLAWYLAYSGRLRRAHQREVVASEARLRLLSGKMITAVEDERRRLARELHDELGQLVTSVSLDLQRARQTADADKRDEALGHALRGTECLLAGIHEVTARIRPPILDDLGLKDAAQSLLGEFQRRTGIVPHVELRLDQDIAPAVSECLYRLLQETLTNVAKHAKASEVVVQLEAAGDAVTLTVQDRGVGFIVGDVDGMHFGLLGMRERVELLGGIFQLDSTPGKGTTVRASLPIGPLEGARQ